MRTIVCFGDSNTYGTPPMPHPDSWGRFGPDERWPGVMRAGLGAGWTVIEEALPGRTTVHDDPIEGADRNGLRALPIVLGSHRPIDLLIINLGTNDLKARFSVAPEDVAASVGVLVRTAQASPAGPDGRAPSVLVVAPPVVAESGFFAGPFKGAGEKSTHFARCYAAVAARFGTAFLDAAPLVASDPLDGIHWRADGHGSLGRAVAQKVREMFGG